MLQLFRCTGGFFHLFWEHWTIRTENYLVTRFLLVTLHVTKKDKCNKTCHSFNTCGMKQMCASEIFEKGLQSHNNFFILLLCNNSALLTQNKNATSACPSWIFFFVTSLNESQSISLFLYIFVLLPRSRCFSLLSAWWACLGFSWEKVTVWPIKESYEETLDAPEVSVSVAFHSKLLWHLHGLLSPSGRK